MFACPSHSGLFILPFISRMLWVFKFVHSHLFVLAKQSVWDGDVEEKDSLFPWTESKIKVHSKVVSTQMTDLWIVAWEREGRRRERPDSFNNASQRLIAQKQKWNRTTGTQGWQSWFDSRVWTILSNTFQCNPQKLWTNKVYLISHKMATPRMIQWSGVFVQPRSTLAT